MLRLKSNCTVMLVVPSELDEVSDEMPEMSESERSIGVATEGTSGMLTPTCQP
jgi:hypothetical protein